MDEDIITFPKAEERSGFVVTPTAERIFQAMDEVIREAPYGSGGLGLIVGAPGIGKTMALHAYGRSRGHDVAIATIDAGQNTTKAVLQTVYEAITGQRPYGITSLSDLHSALVHGLQETSFHRPALIVIDEAQEAEKSLATIRQLHDRTRVPVILSGNAHLTRLIKGRKTQAAFSQIESRLAQELHLPGSTVADVAALCRGLGLSDSGAIEALVEAAQVGNLRRAAIVARKAAVLAGAFNAVRRHHIKIAIAARNGNLGGDQ